MSHELPKAKENRIATNTVGVLRERFILALAVVGFKPKNTAKDVSPADEKLWERVCAAYTVQPEGYKDGQCFMIMRDTVAQVP